MREQPAVVFQAGEKQARRNTTARLASLGVSEELSKAAVSGLGERAAGSEAKRGIGHISHQEATERFLAGNTMFWLTFLNNSSGCSVES